MRCARGRSRLGRIQRGAGRLHRPRSDGTRGPVIVGAAGVLLAGVAALLAGKGVTRRFLADLDLTAAAAGTHRLVSALGVVGYLTLGVAYGIVGGLITAAATDHDPDKATGLDTALSELAGRPYGTGLLLAIAVGFACSGVLLPRRPAPPDVRRIRGYAGRVPVGSAVRSGKCCRIVRAVRPKESVFR